MTPTDVAHPHNSASNVVRKLTPADRVKLATRIGLTPQTVEVWFRHYTRGTGPGVSPESQRKIAVGLAELDLAGPT